MNTTRVDQLLQLALLLASQEEDYKCRSLGPIHLVKYVYLADLAYSIRQGETFTGTKWKFHKFGPWSPEVFSRIEPALAAIGAVKKTLPSAFSDEDYCRWTAFDGPTTEVLERDLPAVITVNLKRRVHEHTSDTASLLHYVYLTKPMLTAAPGDDLDFSCIQLPQVPNELGQKHISEPLSNKAQKRHKEQINTLKATVQCKIADRLRRKTEPQEFTSPRYDVVFENGAAWLDSIAGEPIKEDKGEVWFPPEIWKSPFRYDPDIS